MHIKKDALITYAVISVTVALKMSSLLVFCMLYAGKKPLHRQHNIHTFLQNPSYVPLTYR
ncbi:MAG: hypothetical protein ACHQVS_00355 [Candidatus Babeliales bacterium]